MFVIVSLFVNDIYVNTLSRSIAYLRNWGSLCWFSLIIGEFFLGSNAAMNAIQTLTLGPMPTIRVRLNFYWKQQGIIFMRHPRPDIEKDLKIAKPSQRIHIDKGLM